MPKRSLTTDAENLAFPDIGPASKLQRLCDRLNVSGTNQFLTAGIVESVHLQNFLCHEDLRFDFGPSLNFVTGQNGSRNIYIFQLMICSFYHNTMFLMGFSGGKSAVLSGLVLALGGKATCMNRGGALREYVKYGCNAAIISVTLSNMVGT